eukprot:3848156-Rhodomonas_salina.2
MPPQESQVKSQQRCGEPHRHAHMHTHAHTCTHTCLVCQASARAALSPAQYQSPFQYRATVPHTLSQYRATAPVPISVSVQQYQFPFQYRCNITSPLFSTAQQYQSVLRNSTRPCRSAGAKVPQTLTQYRATVPQTLAS